MKQLMNRLNRLIERIGADRLLHFCVAGWAVSIASAAGWGAALWTAAAMYALAVAKEYAFDRAGDWRDVAASVLGLAASLGAYVLIGALSAF